MEVIKVYMRIRAITLAAAIILYIGVSMRGSATRVEEADAPVSFSAKNNLHPGRDLACLLPRT